MNSNRIGSLSRLQFFGLLGAELGLLIAFAPLVGLLDRYVMSHGGADVLIVVLPVFALAYLILVALFAGAIVKGSSPPEKGKRKWVWWVLGFLGTFVWAIVAANLFGLRVAIVVPLLWTLVLLGLVNRLKTAA